MKIVYTKCIPPKGFLCLNFFGIMVLREEYREYVERWPSLFKRTWNHEAIHTEQMKELFYIGFYILYFIAWIIRLLTPPMATAYKDISFEQEAYFNEDNPDYIATRHPYAWLGYCFTSYRKSQEKH